MSLINFPKAFPVNFSPQLNTAASKTQGSSDPPKVDPFGNVEGDYAELSIVKIIPEVKLMSKKYSIESDIAYFI